MKRENVDAREYVRVSIARDLLAARQGAGLTAQQLTMRINRQLRWYELLFRGRYSWYVYAAEHGHVHCSKRYVLLVLRACGLPDDWRGPAR